ncbi:hypothetical protein M408DRAFT_26120 [Serendipita vermifera MAFF 305830]|uniref:Uncharacterized protein n=1 Tax=Serendipita vermifera MAFF 305830 TaxID=933852 RepID=A0A0C3B221_SERVB|nr:hypothetical protein M408DRAFT_26120 [Serendipita vermifera MAFF 305830]
MSSPLHQAPDCWVFHFQNPHDPEPTQDVLQNREPTAIPPTVFLPHDESLDDCQECLALYHDLVRTDPEMAISWTDLLASGATALAYPDSVETAPPAIATDSNSDHHSEPLVEETSPSTNAAQPTPPSSGSHAHRRYNYHCAVCNHPYDRAQRARDCANRDRGLTPHACGGLCGVLNCTKAYSSEALLREHFAPPEDRDVQCPQCLKTVRKKNIARHQKEACR